MLQILESKAPAVRRSVMNWFQYRTNVTENTTRVKFNRPVADWAEWELEILAEHPEYPIRFAKAQTA